MHHPHHEPQKSRITYLPLSEESERALPWRSLSVKSGTSRPSACKACACDSLSACAFTEAICSSKYGFMRPFFTLSESRDRKESRLSGAT